MSHVYLVLSPDLVDNARPLAQQYEAHFVESMEELRTFAEAQPAENPITRITIVVHSGTPSGSPLMITGNAGGKELWANDLAKQLARTNALAHVEMIDFDSCSMGLMARTESTRGGFYHSAPYPEMFARKLFKLGFQNIRINALTNAPNLTDKTIIGITVYVILSGTVHNPKSTLYLIGFDNDEQRRGFETSQANIKRKLTKLIKNKRAKADEKQQLRIQARSSCCAGNAYAKIEDLKDEINELDRQIKACDEETLQIINDHTLFKSNDIPKAFESNSWFRFYTLIEAEAESLGEDILQNFVWHANEAFNYDLYITKGFSKPQDKNVATSNFKQALASLAPDAKRRVDLYLLKRFALRCLDDLLINPVRFMRPDYNFTGVVRNFSDAADAAAAADINNESDSENEVFQEVTADVSDLESMRQAILKAFGSSWLDEFLRLKAHESPFVQAWVHMVDKQIDHYGLRATIDSNQYKEASVSTAAALHASDGSDSEDGLYKPLTMQL